MDDDAGQSYYACECVRGGGGGGKVLMAVYDDLGSSA